MPKWTPIALAGGFGGTAANIFRVATALTTGGEVPDVSYMIGVFVFFTMGSGIALSFQETDVKKAFFLGMSLPAMFQSSVSEVSTARAAALFSPVVFASTMEEPPRVVEIEYNRDAPDFSFIFSGEKRGRAEGLLMERAEKKEDDGLDRVEVPAWATSFTILVLSDRQQSEPVPVAETDRWYVTVEEKSLRGLKQSIGIPDPERWRITVETKARE